MAQASRDGSLGGTRRPVRPSRTASGVPPTSVATTALEAAMASRIEFGNASLVEQSTDTSNNPCRLGACARCPAKWTTDSMPSVGRERLQARPFRPVSHHHHVDVRDRRHQGGDGVEERGVVLYRREPRDDSYDESPARYAELGEQALAIAISDGIEGLRVEEVRDRHYARRWNTALRFHEPRYAGAVSDDRVGEPVGHPVGPQHLPPKMWRVPRAATGDHTPYPRQPCPQRRVHAGVGIMAVYHLDLLSRGAAARAAPPAVSPSHPTGSTWGTHAR